MKEDRHPVMLPASPPETLQIHKKNVDLLSTEHWEHARREQGQP